MNRNTDRKDQRTPRRKKKASYYFLVALVFFLAWTTVFRLKQGRMPVGNGNSFAMSGNWPSAKPELILATTTSLVDSGLLDTLLPVFERRSGFRVKVLAVGSGEALALGRRQAADLLLVHSPEAERRFMEDGHGQRREEVMAADFIIAGPASDPAGIKELGFPESFSRIASGGFAFVSRADNSGTHELEMKIWSEAEISPSGRWYLETGQGMSESLRIASEKQAYILADYPTFFRLRKGLGLEALSRDGKYKNVYSAIAVKNSSGQVNAAGAVSFIDFLLSEEAQELIDGFGRDSGTVRPLFRALRYRNNGGESNR
ncbi:MAG: substrate-binding domain-containing protein [Candidatus Saccharicenans sp.]|nr:substrate-binding domain-containing protein [Candidatus Saccharicenans sp.]